MEHTRKQQVPKETITSSDTTALEEFDHKTTLFQVMTNSKSFNRSPKQRAIYHALMESILEDEDAMDKGVADKLEKETRLYTGNTDEPHVVNVVPKDWFKKPERPPTLDPEWNEGKSAKNKHTQKWLSDLAKAEKPLRIFDDLMSTPIDFSAFVMNRLQISELIQDILTGTTLKVIDIHSLSKPLPLVMSGNCQIVPVDYFFNNDLAYLQRGSTGRTYTTSLTKTKAAKYDLPRIEDMVPNLVSKHDVYSTKRILAVTNVKVKEWYGYGHLEEIEVRRSDQQLYKFMEGDFPRLHLHDIEDMLILLVQNRLFNLKGDVIVHLAAT
ncbi:hypothetical protein Tco_0719855 [Tanacetum coccineum]